MPGERMVLSSHPHWWYFWKHVAGLLVVVVLFWLASLASWDWVQTPLLWLAVFALIADVVATVIRYADWRTTRFAITDRRVAYQSGLISRRGVSIPLNRVNNVNFSQGAIARLLNNGTVLIESAGESGDSTFTNIPDPAHVRQVIFSQMDADEHADAKRDADAIAQALAGQQSAAASAPPAARQRLEQLEQLRTQGLVSDQEYQAKRAEILGDL